MCDLSHLGSLCSCLRRHPVIALRRGLYGKIVAVREKKMTIESVAIVAVLTALLDAAAGELATEGEFPYHVRIAKLGFLFPFSCV